MFVVLPFLIEFVRSEINVNNSKNKQSVVFHDYTDEVRE